MQPVNTKQSAPVIRKHSELTFTGKNFVCVCVCRCACVCEIDWQMAMVGMLFCYISDPDWASVTLGITLCKRCAGTSCVEMTFTNVLCCCYSFQHFLFCIDIVWVPGSASGDSNAAINHSPQGCLQIQHIKHNGSWHRWTGIKDVHPFRQDLVGGLRKAEV